MAMAASCFVGVFFAGVTNGLLNVHDILITFCGNLKAKFWHISLKVKAQAIHPADGLYQLKFFCSVHYCLYNK